MVKKINILGVNYTVTLTNAEKDKALNQYDGYCDRYAKTIVVSDCKDKDFDTEAIRIEHMNSIFRHEVLHAFLSECGLCESSWAANEEIVDWFANMFPRLQIVFVQLEGGG